MTIFGGESIGDTVSKIGKEQLDIICATPGRLISLIDAHKISLSYVDMVVLDEADQMLEKGLEVMCAELLVGRDMPAPSSGRQTLLFSATMPQKIRDLTPQILRPARTANLLIGHYGDDQGGSCESIHQMLKWCPDENQRIQEMCRDLGKVWDRRKGRVVIFSNMRITADKLTMRLQQQGFNAKHLHGKLEQYVRDQTFDEFRRGAFDILVATNVASRGLDFPDIALVVQFNLPKEIEIYTHRIGRTGRIGQVGIALAYVGPKDRHLNERLASFLELNKQEVPSFLRPHRSPPRRGGRSPPRRGGRY
jgi:ATP-dependent RNA helicase DDX3X